LAYSAKVAFVPFIIRMYFMVFAPSDFIERISAPPSIRQYSATKS
jgi:hypothetical protein